MTCLEVHLERAFCANCWQRGGWSCPACSQMLQITWESARGVGQRIGSSGPVLASSTSGPSLRTLWLSQNLDWGDPQVGYTLP